VANYYKANGKSILEEGVEPTEVIRATAQDDSDVDDDSSSSGTKEAPGPRPLSPDDAVYRKALELLKTPAKKAA
jgi:C-terminal processing protease CtpA/Prc